MIPLVKLRQRPGRHAPRVVLVAAGAVPARYRAFAAAAAFSGEAETVCDCAGGKRRALLVGLGNDPGQLDYEAAGAVAVAHLLQTKHICIDLRGVPPGLAAACLTGAVLRAWRFTPLFSAPPEGAPRLQRIDALADKPALKGVWAAQHAMLRGILLARDLVTEPANRLTPEGFIERLHPLKKAGVAIHALRGKALRKAGLAGLPAVGGASAHPPALAVLRWKGTLDAPPVIFAGKGITFDTGGLCIKPAERMWEMRADMAGAAACAGAMLTLALRKSPAPVTALLALAENTTGAAAYRPGDVLQPADGPTVEVIDTDAEGRLVLMDALGFAVRKKPAAIIDLATLTGSVVTALGHHMAGLFSNDPALAAAVAAAGAVVGEPAWQLPIDASHREALESDIADLRHCSPERGQPDASQAAAFLREFVGETPWAHLDIAGVEARGEADHRHAAGATGFGVRLLDQLVRDRYEEAR